MLHLCVYVLCFSTSYSLKTCICFAVIPQMWLSSTCDNIQFIVCIYIQASLYIKVRKVKEHKMCHEWRKQQTLCRSMRPASTTKHRSRSSWVFNALPRGRGENRAMCAQVLPAASLNLILHGLVMSPFPKLFNLRLLSTPSPPSRLFKLHDESSCAIVINGAL